MRTFDPAGSQQHWQRGSTFGTSLKASTNFYQGQIQKLVEQEKEEFSLTRPIEMRALRRLSIHKQAFMTKKEDFMESIDDTINHGGLLNSSLPDKHEEQL